ncbi:hypothetical protein YC2023_103716 [Brassica napus]
MSLIPLPSCGDPPIRKKSDLSLENHSQASKSFFKFQNPAELGCSCKQHGLNRLISVVETATNKANSRECRWKIPPTQEVELLCFTILDRAVSFSVIANEQQQNGNVSGELILRAQYLITPNLIWIESKRNKN